jgi:D-inositol-3-phosphate glycosyltransferase
MGAVEHASHFGWESTARKTLDVYDLTLTKNTKSINHLNIAKGK